MYWAYLYKEDKPKRGAKIDIKKKQWQEWRAFFLAFLVVFLEDE